MNGLNGATIIVQVPSSDEDETEVSSDLDAMMFEAVEECGAQGDIESTDSEKQPDAEPLIAVVEAQTPPRSPVLARSAPAGVTDVDAKLKALFERQQIVKMLLGLCDETDGESETIHIVMELLGAEIEGPTAVDRLTDQLLSVLPEQTLVDEGIILDNERYHSFRNVLGNYAKIHASRRLIEQLPTLGTGNFLGGTHDEALLARVVADEVLKIPDLMRQFWTSLEEMDFFNEDSAFKAYLKASNHPNGKILRELMLSRISRVFLCVVSSTFYLFFTEFEIIHMLRHCYLSVNSEIEIFLSVILWLEHNWTERSECAERVLAEVRFHLMPTWYLTTLNSTNRCIHFARVNQRPGVKALIAKGLAAVVAKKGSNPHYNSQAAGSFYQMDCPVPREWIADPACVYHHKCHCQRFVYPTYEVFKQYLSRIINSAPNYWHTFRPAQEVYRNQLHCCCYLPQLR
ncbi:uncharacterized protein LOC117890728 [Drosophila subobscura]|uniref:uncharacterized protein LOC117890728 n=1 Tax=Drosophila subobscura TaxID=7241 RepID=UPI00155A2E30|nr:uncharacterized protein LOC117890728 [Drosophila subobscura]